MTATVWAFLSKRFQCFDIDPIMRLTSGLLGGDEMFDRGDPNRGLADRMQLCRGEEVTKIDGRVRKKVDLDQRLGRISQRQYLQVLLFKPTFSLGCVGEAERVDRRAGGKPDRTKRCDRMASRVGLRVDDQIDVAGQSCEPVRHNREPTHHDVARLGVFQSPENALNSHRPQHGPIAQDCEAPKNKGNDLGLCSQRWLVAVG